MKISVIVPIYNTEEYLERCLDSLINQTIDDYEIILIDDGSTDNSRAIAERYEKEYDNVILLSQKNKGQSAARNYGLKHARGEYIYFCDSDDFTDINLLQKGYENSKKYSTDIFFFNFKEIKSSESCKEKVYDSSLYVNTEDILSGRELLQEGVLSDTFLNVVWSQIYRKKFLEDNNFYFIEGVIYEDVDFVFKTMMHAKRIKYCPEVLYTYIRREGSTTTKKVDNKNVSSMEQVLISIYKWIDKLKLIDSEIRLVVAIKKYINRFFEYILKLISKSNMKNKNILISECIEKFLYKYIYEFKNTFTISDYFAIKRYLEYYCEVVGNSNYCYSKLHNILDEEYNSIQKLESIIEFKLRKILSDISFNYEDKLIGVYGIGSHTKKLFMNYEKYIGEIRAKIIFIDTNGEKKEFLNKKVIGVKEINDYKFDEIIISSKPYEKILLRNVENYLDKRIKIINFYDKEWDFIFKEINKR